MVTSTDTSRSPVNLPVLDDELDLLASVVPLGGARILEVGCGAARLARDLLHRFPDAEVLGIDVDDRQLAKNLAQPMPRLRFEHAAAEAIPFGNGQFDGALMLKSLHHVPRARMDQALAEIARVLRSGGWLYVSEPVYAGPFNEVIRLFNDEGVVRSAAQAALDRALATSVWSAGSEHRFEMPVHFANFEEFEQRMMRPTFADHGIDVMMLEKVSAAYAPHQGPAGAQFMRPMHVRVLRRAG